MPLFNKWKEEGATWGIWEVTESVDELRSLLTEKSCVLTELNQFKCEGRRLEYLAVRVLLKELLGEEFMIAHYPSGKPYLSDHSQFITISHTKGYVAVGVHPTKEVGIDIEQVSERVRKVSSRFVREDELQGLNRHELDVQLYELLLVWSAKEAMFKVLNTSEVDFLEHLFISKFSFNSSGTLVGREFKTRRKKVFGIHYLTHPDFVLTYLTTK